MGGMTPEPSRAASIAALGALAACVPAAIAAVVVTRPLRVLREVWVGLPLSAKWPIYVALIAAGLALFVVGCVAIKVKKPRLALGVGLASTLLTFSVWAHATKLFVPRPDVPADLSPIGSPCSGACPAGYLCFGPIHGASCEILCGPDGVRACPQGMYCSEREICEREGVPRRPVRPDPEVPLPSK